MAPKKAPAKSPTRISGGAHASTSAGNGAARPAAKRPVNTARGYKRPERLEDGYIIEDKTGKKTWRVGPVIGQGGFADVYLVSDKASKPVTEGTAKHVMKLEPSDNGPLYQEVKFFKAAAKSDAIAAFLRERSIKSLGIMEYISSGVMEVNDKNLRWLILPRLDRNVQQILDECDGIFSRQCVILLALQLLDILEYIHKQGYAHADLKATNLMTGLSKTDASQVYLIDFGLVKRFMDDNKHIPYKEEPKAAHDGTLELTSTDAHKGAAPSRRGDLQILGFNLIKWLTGSLPWSDSTDPNFVRSQKITYFQNQSEFFRVAFPDGAPKEITDYFKAIRDLQYHDEPNYAKLREIFQKASKDVKARKSDLFATASAAQESVDSADSVPVPKKRATRSAAVALSIGTSEAPPAKRGRKPKA
ncbi:serine/threonine-protein kinase VRK1-like [Paramacrobiotus metropolitanus]|uniref:serine/threonine-protein kinase VRK1-like n=1 Tax=Paramacrobiotus metropolitanus TaxID=2943436 RepID=UPI002446444A|nr:serine/threonine-protein kinase VRK1-like [Paramacrobiotus metropolitanus]